MFWAIRTCLVALANGRVRRYILHAAYTGIVLNNPAAPYTYEMPYMDFTVLPLIAEMRNQLLPETVRPEQVAYDGPAQSLREVWIAVRANLRSVLETVTLADLADGRLPEPVTAIASDPDAWLPH